MIAATNAPSTPELRAFGWSHLGARNTDRVGAVTDELTTGLAGIWC